MIIEKLRNFPALDEGHCQGSMAFCILGPSWPPKACLTTWGRSTPFSLAYWENWPTFFEVRVFPAAQVGLGVNSPHKSAEHHQSTPRTPPVHLPLSTLDGRLLHTCARRKTIDHRAAGSDVTRGMGTNTAGLISTIPAEAKDSKVRLKLAGGHGAPKASQLTGQCSSCSPSASSQCSLFIMVRQAMAALAGNY